MANEDHVAMLRLGPMKWNSWRRDNPDILPDLSDANLQNIELSEGNFSNANLSGANLEKTSAVTPIFTSANLSGANLNYSNLFHANFSHAKFEGARLSGAFFTDANLEGADLSGVRVGLSNFVSANMRNAILRQSQFSECYFNEADLSEANLCDANLSGSSFFKAILKRAKLASANLTLANLVKADLAGADLTGCRVFGVSAWDLKLENAKQQNLVIEDGDEFAIMVDDLEVAQFIHLLLKRDKIRNVIDTVTRKGVLLLGRFNDGGLPLLQAVAAWLRAPGNGGYLPLLFDFPRPHCRTYTETIRTLAGLARFVIVDLSGPSVPQEITATVDAFEIPFVPILQQDRTDWSMFKDFLVKERVLKPVVRFNDEKHLLQLLARDVIAPAEKLIEKRQHLLDELFGST